MSSADSILISGISEAARTSPYYDTFVADLGRGVCLLILCRLSYRYGPGDGVWVTVKLFLMFTTLTDFLYLFTIVLGTLRISALLLFWNGTSNKVLSALCLFEWLKVIEASGVGITCFLRFSYCFCGVWNTPLKQLQKLAFIF